MFNFIRKSFPHFRHSLTTSSLTYELHILLRPFSSSISLKPTSDYVKDHSFTVNYLINKCGFSLERSISASKDLNFDKPDKPDAVIAFLQNQGLSETQVVKLIRNLPPIVVCDPKKTLLPKIEFYLSQGLSRADVAKAVAASPEILKGNLDRTIIPTFNCLKKLLGSAEDAMHSIRLCRRHIRQLQHNVIPNIEILQKAGVPEPRVKSFLRNYPQNLTGNPKIFKETVDEVKKMGVDPLKSTFCVAVNVLLALSRCSWKKKMEVYKRWGCSEDQVLKAFVINPWCMAVSEKKIDLIMEYFVKEMGWDPVKLIHKSLTLSYSLNRRIIPRCSVYQVLLSKGFIKENSSLYTLLSFPEERFLNKYVECYEKEAPELLKLYQEKMNFSR